MAIDPRKIINSPLGLKFAFLLGKYMPYQAGQRIALFIGDRISSRKDWRMIQIVRCNQWIVSGCETDKIQLDELVRANLRNIASSVFDYYYTLNDPTTSLKMIEPHPFAIQLVQRPEFSERGFVCAGIHMSNFDMAFQVGGLAGVKGITLTVPEFNPAYQKQYEIRRKSGLNVLPTSFASIRHSIDHLRAGGLVITALDWPDPNSTYRPKFFGIPSKLPIHHVFLALKACVPIVVAGIYKHSDGKYHFLFSEPIEMQSHSDREQEMLINAEIVLQVAESYIRRNPSQWSMSYPVWPEAVDRVPF